jgi:hypothetical protein
LHQQRLSQKGTKNKVGGSIAVFGGSWDECDSAELAISIIERLIFEILFKIQFI